MLRLTLQTLKVAAIATMALLTLAFGQRFFTYYLDRAKANDAGPVLFTIAPDESSDAVGQRLADLGLINSTVYFKAKLRLRGSDEGELVFAQIVVALRVAKEAAAGSE